MVARSSDEKRNATILRIHNRYFRKVMAHPDGAVVHFGDCNFYSSCGICTCGLLHDLRMVGEEGLACELYANYREDLYFHERNLDSM